MNKAFCQTLDLLTRLCNDSIQYTVTRISPKYVGVDRLSSPKNIISVEIGDEDMKLLKSIKRDEWITALHDTKKDWAANLLLYTLYEKDATTFIIIKTREKWVNTYKEEDIKFWEKILK
ncbi:hypothetical protein QNI19_20040 [Cytophagaceae bacterium DM2B3-1]|uniref:Uncharacterized protein n=1 Tax=Xanthocytophaga flava TaxID=3048013 RepID=A0ABT7CNC0_9BACT|nr:hypothetical protein [Xanthocytophaga flavus]MDJ1495241.1 hypothetical protein [Xanthocytophaga flavus]